MKRPHWAAETHIGLHRQINEDRYVVFDCPLGQVFVVCDGMGGHEAGEVAATIAIQTIQNILSGANTEHPPDYWLRRSLNAAHIAISQAPQQGIGTPHMGTTAVILLITPQNEAWWAHVGDSRLYLYRQGKLHALTRDHSLVAWYVESGFITPAQAHRHPESNQLLLSLGGSREVFLIEAPSVPLSIRPDDIFLLCSDGLSSYVSESTIAQILHTSQPIAEKTKALIHAALHAGGYDNITVILVSSHVRPIASSRRLSLIAGLALLTLGIALLSGLAGFYLGDHSSSRPLPASRSDSLSPSHSPSPTPLAADTSQKDSSPAPKPPSK
jgi:serine/threonine protein phosphatase PrpC